MAVPFILHFIQVAFLKEISQKSVENAISKALGTGRIESMNPQVFLATFLTYRMMTNFILSFGHGKKHF